MVCMGMRYLWGTAINLPPSTEYSATPNIQDTFRDAQHLRRMCPKIIITPHFFRLPRKRGKVIKIAKYIAIAYGTGYGCDYTIGCNLRVHDASDPIYSNIKNMRSWDDLERYKTSLLKHYGDIKGNGDIKREEERLIKKITFIEVSKMKDVSIKEELNNLRQKQLIRKKEEKERREYERLKKKFS